MDSFLLVIISILIGFVSLIFGYYLIAKKHFKVVIFVAIFFMFSMVMFFMPNIAIMLADINSYLTALKFTNIINVNTIKINPSYNYKEFLNNIYNLFILLLVFCIYALICQNVLCSKQVKLWLLRAKSKFESISSIITLMLFILFAMSSSMHSFDMFAIALLIVSALLIVNGNYKEQFLSNICKILHKISNATINIVRVFLTNIFYAYQKMKHIFLKVTTKFKASNLQTNMCFFNTLKEMSN